MGGLCVRMKARPEWVPASSQKVPLKNVQGGQFSIDRKNLVLSNRTQCKMKLVNAKNMSGMLIVLQHIRFKNWQMKS